MRRLPTMVALGAWAGFLSTSAVVTMLAVFEIATPSALGMPLSDAEASSLAQSLLAGGNAAIAVASFTSLLSLMIAATLGVGIWLVQGEAQANRRIGEGVAFGALLATGVLGTIGWLSGFRVFANVDSMATFAGLLFLSMLSIAFDRMLDVDDDDTGDEDFRAAATLIGEGMARDVMLRASRNIENPAERSR